MGATIGPGPLESIGHLAIVGQGNALTGEGGPGAIAAQALEACPVVLANLDRSVRGEAVERD